ncbi:MAG: RNA polymerase sigma factor [Gemmatimonadota bacterium]|nr:RNA polymerase sigma factor [Gemmatimonadota bacterium]MDH3427823.1 RNA polymerase sigma factor [Gemmatimonadota bacterium]
MNRRNADFRSDTGEERESDAVLVAQAIAGSDRAFSLLVDRYNDLLYRHAERMLGQADDAEDATQAAWIKAYRNLRKCRDPDRFGSWVFRIGANACKDAVKAKRRGRVSLESVAELESEEPVADVAVRWDQRRLLAAALDRLSPDQSEAFLLKHMEGWSYEEMAEQLGVGIPALKMRVHRAREELQRLLLEVSR